MVTELRSKGSHSQTQSGVLLRRWPRQGPCYITECSLFTRVLHALPAAFGRQVRELTASVGSLSRAAREAEAAHAHAAHVASTAVSDAASASAATLEDAAAATQAAARAEQHARDTVSQLQLRVQVLRQAHAGELGPPPSASPLLEPLRARQVQLQGELEACGAKVAAAQRELQGALEAANEVRIGAGAVQQCTPGLREGAMSNYIHATVAGCTASRWSAFLTGYAD